MATNNSNDDFDDELLSAYVDDELTVAERALVAERLRVDPQARQMVEEVRSLSSAIPSLPRETLGRDLRASIAAEAMQAKADAKADADDRIILPMSGRDRWANYRRGLVWSAITIAAALMLMMVQPEDVDEGVRDVAKADREEELEESRMNRRGGVADGALPPPGEMRALGGPEEATKPMVADGAPATGLAAPAAPATAASSAMPADVLAEAPRRQLDELESLSKLESAAEPSPPPPSDAAALGTLADKSGAQDDAFNSMPQGGAAGAGPSTPSGDLVRDKSKDQPAAAAAAQPATIELAMTAPDGVARFEKLLRQHAIQLGPEPAAADEEVNAKQLNEEVAEHLNKETFSRSLEPAGGDAGRENAAEADDSAGVELLVEASPAQIDALVASCQSDKASFASVIVPVSELWRYARAAPFADATADAQRAGSARGSAVASGGFGGEAAGASAPSQELEAKKPDAKDETRIPAARSELNQSRATGRAWRLRTRGRAEPELAKAKTEALNRESPQPGQVQVLFVLRPAPWPAEPADAKP